MGGTFVLTAFFAAAGFLTAAFFILPDVFFAAVFRAALEALGRARPALLLLFTALVFFLALGAVFFGRLRAPERTDDAFFVGLDFFFAVFGEPALRRGELAEDPFFFRAAEDLARLEATFFTRLATVMIPTVRNADFSIGQSRLLWRELPRIRCGFISNSCNFRQLLGWLRLSVLSEEAS